MYYGPSPGVAVAYIEDEEDRYSLFEALRYAGEEFFGRAAGDRRYSAFGVGNKVLEKVCTHTNAQSIDQCVRAFYCWLDGEVTSDLQNDVFEQSEIIENIGREIELDCGSLSAL